MKGIIIEGRFNYSAQMKMRLITMLLVLMLSTFAQAGAEEGERFLHVIRQAAVCAVDSDMPPDFTKPSCEVRSIDRINPQGQMLWVGASITVTKDFIESEKPLAIHIGALASSKIYWNGELIGANGMPGASRSSEAPGQLDAGFFVPRRLLVEGENEIAIAMSSFHNPIPVRAPFHYLYSAAADTFSAPLAYYYVPALLTAGAFALAAIYFGLLWFNDRQNTGAIFIALMAFFAGMQLFAESLRAFVPFEYPWQVWRLIAVGICAAGFSLAMIVYVARRFQRERWKTFFALTMAMMPAAIFAPGFDGKALASLLIPTVIAIFAVARPAMIGEHGARIAGAALLGFLALIFIDGQNFLDRTFFLAAGGLTLVLFADQARSMRAMQAAKEEMRRRAERLELELLRRKIAPHFLMNTLNALVEWVESDPKTGVDMIEALAEEFRLLSQMSSRALVPLSDEIALCRRHLEVMSYRVDREFIFESKDIDRKMKVPPGVIHTLIENGFTHGKFADGAKFSLRQINSEGRVTLTFETPPAVEQRQSSKDAGGDGLAYVRKRLEAAFGASASFTDGPSKNGGWRSTLSFEGVAR